MSDRHERARGEAERRWPGKMALAPVMRARFIDGVEWADANPSPITEAELNEAAMLIADDLPARGTPPAYELIERVLRSLRIEVVGDE